MKKTISLLAVVLALTLLLTGCAGKAPQTGITTTTKPAEETVDVSLGQVEGSVYENAFVGYGCALDENWAVYSAEELQDLSDLTKEMLKDTELLESSEQYHYFLDMKAENATDLTVINVGYTYLSVKDRLANALLNEEQLVDSTISQKDTLAESFAATGITLNSMEKAQINFIGQQRWAIHTDAVISDEAIGDVPYYVLQIFDMTPGAAYYVTLTLASYLDDNTEALLDLFYPVSK